MKKALRAILFVTLNATKKQTDPTTAQQLRLPCEDFMFVRAEALQKLRESHHVTTLVPQAPESEALATVVSAHGARAQGFGSLRTIASAIS